MPTSHLLFLLGRSGSIKVVDLLSILQSQDGCWQFSLYIPLGVAKCPNVCAFFQSHRVWIALCVFTSCLQRLTFTALRDMHRELAMNRCCAWVRQVEWWEFPWAIGRIHQRDIINSLRTSFLMESMKQLVGSASPLLSCIALLSILDEVRKKWASLAAFHSARDQAVTHMLIMVKIMGSDWALLALSYGALGWGWYG